VGPGAETIAGVRSERLPQTMAMLDGPKQIAEMKNVRHLVDLTDGMKPEPIHTHFDAESYFGVEYGFRCHEF
jgi:hypothetical protein